MKMNDSDLDTFKDKDELILDAFQNTVYLWNK